MLGVTYMNINNELFVDIKKFLNHPWSITTKDLEQYDAEINQAAKAVTELRNTGGEATEGPSDEGTVPGHFQIWYNH